MQSLRYKPNTLREAFFSSPSSIINLRRTRGVTAAPISSIPHLPTLLVKNHAGIIKPVDYFFRSNGGYSDWGPSIVRSSCFNKCRFFTATPPTRNDEIEILTDELQESSLTPAKSSIPASGFASIRQNWDMMFEELKEYKSEHGDTLVPATYPPNPPLGNWVDNQRQTYRMRCEAERLAKEGFSNSTTDRFISDERIEKLNKIGFVWNLNDFSWNKKFEEFLLYVKEHGNTLVPHNHNTLGHWVVKQRRNYKVRMLREEKESNPRKSGADLEVNDFESGISDERIQKLNEVGFVWNVHEAQWLERFEELKKYREDHGDTLVPKSYSVYPFLGRWVDKQRLDYKRFMERKQTGKIDKNKPTGMTEERIQLLEDVDFIWDPFQYAWDMKYNELCDFISINGHSAIRAKRGSKNFPLARWVSVQRSYYKKYLNGEKTSLTEQRIKKLNEIGFVWENSDVDEMQQMAKSMRKSRTKLHHVTKKDV